MYDLIIIGSGPAGLSAAVYGIRAGLDLLVLEEKPMNGGQVLNTYEVDNYLGLPGLSGFDMGMKFKEHADRMGVACKTATVTAVIDQGQSKTVETADGTAYEAKTLILATGAEHAALHVPGEEQYKGRGVSYCATCDGAFFRKRTVAVVGGGDVAVEDAIFLAAICKKVYLIHRRDALRAADSLQKKLMSLENIEILWNSEVKEIQGQDMVDHILVYNNKEKSEQQFPVDGIFIAVGVEPNTQLFEGLVEMDEGGYIIADEGCETSAVGLFAAGDIRRKPMRQIITAVADGANAIHSVQNYFRGM